MLQIEHELKQLCREHRHDGHTTQRDRLAMSKTIARNLDESGFHKFCRQKKCAWRLKDKHVRALVEHWRGGGLSPGTINNRLAFLRHVFKWTGKAGLMHKNNAAYHDGKRVRYATVSKAAYVQPGALERVGNQLAKASMRLQITFGLRRKEALMIQPAKADKGTYIALDGRWCKGNRPRIIPIDSPEQRAALDFAKSVARGGSLIPPSMAHEAYRDGQWRRACEALGVTATHGFRHAWAQDLYEGMTGMPCPVRGGLRHRQMTSEQIRKDQWARDVISKELGHGRRKVTNWYLGKPSADPKEKE